MRLSIIIPLYNCAPVIRRCLNSIDYLDGMEIIVVDDGSTDNGASIVKQYSVEHPYVKLICKQNGGVSDARNVGIDNSFGDYLMFIDADDYIVPGGLERILEIAEQKDADVLKYKVARVESEDPTDTSSAAQWPINQWEIIGKGKALCGNIISDFNIYDGLYKRKVVIDNNVRFHTDLYLHEDDTFMAELYIHSSKVIGTDLPLYRYVVSSNYSQTHKTSSERTQKIINSAILAIQYRHEAIQTLNDPMANNIERIKSMRIVFSCSKKMIDAAFSYQDYCKTLYQFKSFGCWPLQYKWLKVCLYVSPKLVFKTFLCNHPKIAWIFYRKEFPK